MAGKESGEKQIERILKELNIKFSRKKKLTNLKKDAKKFRIPDFYIEKYDLVIEFFGSWNNKNNKSFEKRERSRFMEKVGAYEESGLNCLYLYPEDSQQFKEKILSKINEIKEKRKAEEITQSISIKKENETKTVENKVIIINEQKKIEPIKKEIMKPKIIVKRVIDDSLLKKSILSLDIIGLLLFFFMTIIIILLIFEGNPLVSDLHVIGQSLYFIFLIVIILSIILSALFAFQKEISKGFIYVSVILIVFFFILQLIFGGSLIQSIIIILSVFGIIPSQAFMVFEN